MKIAVFATGWNGEYLRDMYHGLENSQKEFHDSIHLYASFGRLGSGDSFNKSEFDFFELADMSEYDGFLYPSTTVKEGDVKQRLLERIIESKKPCVSLEEEIPGLSFVGINQSKAMRQIVRHLRLIGIFHPVNKTKCPKFGNWGFVLCRNGWIMEIMSTAPGKHMPEK